MSARAFRKAKPSNGGFESGTAGWTVKGGAKVVTGNESFFVHDGGDRYSLSLPAGSSATSPPMCGTLPLLTGSVQSRFTPWTGAAAG